jgi:hypothetical protein
MTLGAVICEIKKQNTFAQRIDDLNRASIPKSREVRLKMSDTGSHIN